VDIIVVLIYCCADKEKVVSTTICQHKNKYCCADKEKLVSTTINIVVLTTFSLR
jgi:hypothetical protein